MSEKKTLFSNVYVIAAIVLAVVTAGLLMVSGPGRGNSPEGVLYRMEKAINKQDMKALLSCYDSEVRQMSGYMNSVQAGALLFGDYDADEVQYHYIVISRTDDETDADAASYQCARIVTYKDDGWSEVRRENISFVKEKGKWYIKY